MAKHQYSYSSYETYHQFIKISFIKVLGMFYSLTFITHFCHQKFCAIQCNVESQFTKFWWLVFKNTNFYILLILLLLLLLLLPAAMTYNQVHYFQINHLAG